MTEKLTHEKEKAPTRKAPTRLRRAMGRVGNILKGGEPSEASVGSIDAYYDELAAAGYNELSGAAGGWGSHKGSSNATRVVYETAFYNPDGRVSRITRYKFEDPFTGRTVGSDWQRADYRSQAGYDKHVEDWRLTVGERKPFQHGELEPRKVQSVEEELRTLESAGYTDYQFGTGPWLEDDSRILKQWGFQHPEGKSAAIFLGKVKDQDGNSRRASLHYAEFPSTEAYQQWLAENQVEITGEGSIADWLAEIESSTEK